MNEINIFIAVLLACTLFYPVLEILILLNMMGKNELIDNSYTHTSRHVILLAILIYAQFDFLNVTEALIELLNGEHVLDNLGFPVMNILLTHHLADERDVWTQPT